MGNKCLFCNEEIKNPVRQYVVLGVMALMVIGCVYTVLEANKCNNFIEKVKGQYQEFIRNLTCSELLQYKYIPKLTNPNATIKGEWIKYAVQKDNNNNITK